MAQKFESLIHRLEEAVCRLESASSLSTSTTAAPAAAADDGPLPAFVGAFDQWLSGPVAEFVRCSLEANDKLRRVTDSLHKLLSAQRAVLVIASKCSKPNEACLKQLNEFIVKNLASEISDLTAKTPNIDDLYNYLKVFSETVDALLWIFVSPAPMQHVENHKESAHFYANRAGKRQWTTSFLNMLNELKAYVKQHHTTGLSWNPRGGDAQSSLQALYSGGAVAKTGAGPPAPPVAPPPPSFLSSTAGAGQEDSRAKLFSDLNRGGDVTKGLRRVTKDMQTHKNPALRAEAPSKAATGGSGGATGGGAGQLKSSGGQQPVKPPLFQLVNKTWKIEHQRDQKELIVDNTVASQKIYILACCNSTIKVKGKVNNITLDSCVKTALVCDSVISSVELVGCHSVEIQVMGTVPFFSVEKTDGLQLYLSKDSLNAELVTSKSSGMNVLVPQADGDFKELPVPEQYTTVLKGGVLVTAPKELV